MLCNENNRKGPHHQSPKCQAKNDKYFTNIIIQINLITNKAS